MGRITVVICQIDSHKLTL